MTARPMQHQPSRLEPEHGRHLEQAIAPKEFPRIPRADSTAAWIQPGYRAEVVLEDLIYPTSIETDDAGNLYVAEAGYAYGDLVSPARVWRIDAKGGLELLADQLNGPINDILLHDGKLYVSQRGKISVIEGKSIRDIVSGLPSMGDHHNNQMSFGPDGKLYFGEGTATNSGVVGLDNVYPFLWLTQYPDVHDVPAHDLKLTGTTFTTPDALTVLARQGEMVSTPAAVKQILSKEDPLLVSTGAFQPFGRASETIKGEAKSNGTILRVNPDGSGLEVYAWGLRNPYGVAWAPNGKLYVAELGFDERGSRPIANAPDVLWAVRQGGFYGWPDYAAGMPVTDPRFKSSRGPAPTLILREHPPVEQPWVVLPPHTSPTKLDVAPAKFGYDGQLFIGEIGGAAPVNAPGEAKPAPQVVRVDPSTGQLATFFRVKDQARGPRPFSDATAGPRRPVGVRFARDGSALYVADVGALAAYPAGAGPVVHPFPGTGVIWRITKEGVAPKGPPPNGSMLPRATR